MFCYSNKSRCENSPIYRIHLLTLVLPITGTNHPFASTNTVLSTEKHGIALRIHVPPEQRKPGPARSRGVEPRGFRVRVSRVVTIRTLYCVTQTYKIINRIFRAKNVRHEIERRFGQPGPRSAWSVSLRVSYSALLLSIFFLPPSLARNALSIISCRSELCYL